MLILRAVLLSLCLGELVAQVGSRSSDIGPAGGGGSSSGGGGHSTGGGFCSPGCSGVGGNSGSIGASRGRARHTPPYRTQFFCFRTHFW